MNKPNILLVVMDSVPAMRMSTYGYKRKTTPRIDAFAEEATVYENAIANSSWTVPTHGTLFTGMYPTEHEAHAHNKRFSVPSERTLAGKLSEAGYRTVGLSTNPWVSTEFNYDTGFEDFEDVRPPLPVDSASPRELFQRLDDEDPRIYKYIQAAKWAAKGNPVKRSINLMYYRQKSKAFAEADTVNNHVTKWLDDHNSQEPFFMFLNYMDAHEPYEPPEEFLSKFRNDNCSVDVSWHLRSLNEQYSESEKKCISDRYDASLRHLDDHLGRLFNILEERNLSDDTLIVLTSDHGKCLGEHNYMGVGTFLYNELIRIPLVVSPPSQETSANASDLISQIDIHQHILEAAGLDTPKRGYDGVYSETIGPHQDVTVRSRSLPEEGLRRIEIDGTSLIRDVNTNEASFEGSPTSDQRVKLEQLESEYVNGMVEFRKQSVDGDMDEATRDHLEELGYL